MGPGEARRLAARLRREREAKGLSASEVARRAGIDVGTVSRIEQGYIPNPRPESLVAMAAVLDMPASDLFATANWIPSNELPSFAPYLRAKYAHLPEAAQTEIEAFFSSMTAKYGTAGPAPGEDEY